LYNLKAKIRQGGLSGEIPINAFPFGIGYAVVVENHSSFSAEMEASFCW
jgi:hypothetical protein